MTVTIQLPSLSSPLPQEINDLGRTPRRVILGIAFAGCFLRLFFWFYTHRNWEDALTSVLHSENLVNGLGLTHYHPGYPRLHGFTSPLSVLVPLAGDIFHAGWGLSLIKIVSALISIPTVLLGAAIVLHRSFHVSNWLVYLLCCYLAFEHHQLLWGMAGMETQIAVFVLFLTCYHALKLNRRALAVSMALCLYARPDFAMFLAIVAIYLWVTDRSSFFRSVGLAAVLYAPWLLFTTLYYGSPVPNTIIAKSVGYSSWSHNLKVFSAPFFNGMWMRIWDFIFLPMGPSFASHASGFLKFIDDGFLSRLAAVVMFAGIAAMISRFHRFYIIPLGFLACYSVYYVFVVPAIFGWYLVPFTAVNYLILVLGLSALLATCVLPYRMQMLARVMCVWFILPLLVVLPTTFRADHDIQAYIETPVRMAIGRYLFEHKRPNDRVGCEPLGYISYYSRMPVYDYPGLASAEVVNFLKQNPNRRTLDSVLEHFRPEWIALREPEYRYYVTLAHMKFLETGYTLERIFRSDPVHTNEIFRVDHNVDLTFYLLRKRS